MPGLLLHPDLFLSIQNVLWFFMAGERIAVEYLLARSDRGDLLVLLQHGEMGIALPEMQIEGQEDEMHPDVTMCDPADLGFDTSHTPSCHNMHVDSFNSSSQVM